MCRQIITVVRSYTLLFNSSIDIYTSYIHNNHIKSPDREKHASPGHGSTAFFLDGKLMFYWSETFRNPILGNDSDSDLLPKSFIFQSAQILSQLSVLACHLPRQNGNSNGKIIGDIQGKVLLRASRVFQRTTP